MTVLRSTGTYAEIVEHNRAYCAQLYRSRLPFLILTLGVAGVFLVGSFFLLPWFTVNAILGPSNFLGLTIATNGVPIGGASNGTVSIASFDTFSFPLLWLLLAVGVAQIALAVYVLINKREFCLSQADQAARRACSSRCKPGFLS